MSRRYPPQTFMPNHDAYMIAKRNCLAACSTYNQVADHVSSSERARLLRCILPPLIPNSTDGKHSSAESNQRPEDLEAVNEHMPSIEPPLYVQYGSNVQIGLSTTIERNLMIFDCPVAPVRVGPRCRIGPNTAIYTEIYPDQDHRADTRSARKQLAAAVTIEEDCWIGGGVTICAGVHIGRGSTVEDGSVVIQNVEPGQHVSGNPAVSTLPQVLDSDASVRKVSNKSSRSNKDHVQALQLLTALFKCMTSFMKLKGEKAS